MRSLREWEYKKKQQETEQKTQGEVASSVTMPTKKGKEESSGHSWWTYLKYYYYNKSRKDANNEVIPFTDVKLFYQIHFGIIACVFTHYGIQKASRNIF